MRILLLFAVTLLVACHQAKKVTTTPTPTVSAATPIKTTGFVQWDKKMVDLGTVKKGVEPTFFYEFTNVSAEIVKIEIVDACDCTKVDWPRGNIAPGEKARLNVVFKSGDKDASETIGINVVFSNLAPDGNPRIEVVEYKFELVK
jgi:peptidoglycan-associated lipoprotein